MSPPNTSSLTPSVTIADILRLALPLKTEVVATPRDLRVAVQWAVWIASWNKLSDQAQAGDLALVPAALQRKSSTTVLLKQIEALSTLSLAGLLFFEPVPDKVTEMARQVNLPILVVPTEYSARDIHHLISGLLMNRQTAVRERGLQLYRRLSEMSREGEGLDEMTAVISNLVGKIVVIQDKRLTVQAVAVPQTAVVDLNSIAPMLNRREQLPAVLRNRKAAARSRQAHWQQLLPVGDGGEAIGRVVSPIIAGDRARGYLSVIGIADELDSLDSLAAEQGAAACALEMAKAKAVSEAKKEMRGNFLEGVLAGTSSAKEIERLAGRLDHDTTPPHAVLTFAWHGTDTPSPRRLETMLLWLLNNHKRAALTHLYGGNVLCVFQTLNGRDDMETAVHLGQRLRSQAAKEYPEAHLLSGISGPAEGLSAWPKVYAEALQAMDLGERLHIDDVVTFSSLGVYRLLIMLEDIPDVRLFMRQTVGPLVAYDEQHRSSLMETLDAYFNYHGNISKTAESLFIHRNTLLYRLDRIQELTTHDLSQANMRLALQLALKLYQLRPLAIE